MAYLDDLLHVVKTDKRAKDACFEAVKKKLYEGKSEISARHRFDEDLEFNGAKRNHILETYLPRYENGKKARTAGYGAVGVLAFGIAAYFLPIENEQVRQAVAAASVIVAVGAGIKSIYHLTDD